MWQDRSLTAAIRNAGERMRSAYIVAGAQNVDCGARRSMVLSHRFSRADRWRLIAKPRETAHPGQTPTEERSRSLGPVAYQIQECRFLRALSFCDGHAGEVTPHYPYWSAWPGRLGCTESTPSIYNQDRSASRNTTQNQLQNSNSTKHRY